ncbi:hypothetical protein RRG08_037420 [Elysia crispata]|uniref:Uncharacterized protein n=1 Tax=Elysia crispata TaxID=231223 RepID=A0AAE1AGA4_9GAST|nr:hypothetical protein RRG08_037420 [Elysia crispata]
MLGSSSVRSCVVASFFLLLTLSYIDVCTAKSFVLQDDYMPTDSALVKKNSWWSKKSLDSASDYNRLLKDYPREETSVDGREPVPAGVEYGTDAVSELYGCYITTCVPEFVRCAERSRSHSSTLASLGLTDRSDLSFSQCRRNHQLCALECRVSSTKNAYDV